MDLREERREAEKNASQRTWNVEGREIWHTGLDGICKGQGGEPEGRKEGGERESGNEGRAECFLAEGKRKTGEVMRQEGAHRCIRKKSPAAGM